MKAKLYCLAILTALIAVFFMRPSQAQVPMYCFSDFETAKAKAAEHDEKFIYRGTNLLGIEMFVFSGPKTWTIFIKSNAGFCTSPALIGIKKAPGIDT